MNRLLKVFAGDVSGATAIEYVFIAAFLSVAIVAGATAVGTALSAKFTAIGNKLS